MKLSGLWDIQSSGCWRQKCPELQEKKMALRFSFEGRVWEVKMYDYHTLKAKKSSPKRQKSVLCSRSPCVFG